MRVVTDLMQITAEQITQIYKARWQIEVFFRWIKQHLNVPTLFGTTENAVYGQLFGALIVYVLLKWLYDGANSRLPRHVVLSFVPFSRFLVLGLLPVEWQIRLKLLIPDTPLIT
nr:transposase [Paenibacillus hemerocallicola]